MNKTLVYGLAISMIASSMAIAAPQKKAAVKPAAKAAKVNKKETAKAAQTAATQAAATEVAAAPVAAPVVAEPVAVSAPVAQSTASAAAVTAEAKPSKFGVMINDRMNINTKDVNQGQTADGGQVEGDGTLTVRPSYKINDTLSASVGIDVLHSYGAKSNRKANWTPLDPYMMLAKSNLATLPGGIKTKGSVRFYVPTSEASQAQGQIGQLRGGLTLAKGFGPLTVSYIAEPRAYFQQYNTFAKAQADGTSKEVATRSYRYTQTLSAELQILSNLSASTSIGLDHQWYNSDSNVGVVGLQKDGYLAETALSVAVNDNVALTGGLEVDSDATNLRDPNVNTKQGLPYREEVTTYFVEGTVTF